MDVKLEAATFRGRDLYRVMRDGDGRACKRFIGLVMRVRGTKTRWQWVAGYSQIRSPWNFPSKIKAAQDLSEYLKSSPRL